MKVGGLNGPAVEFRWTRHPVILTVKDKKVGPSYMPIIPLWAGGPPNVDSIMLGHCFIYLTFLYCTF